MSLTVLSKKSNLNFGPIWGVHTVCTLKESLERYAARLISSEKLWRNRLVCVRDFLKNSVHLYIVCLFLP